MPISKNMTYSSPWMKYLGYLVLGVLLVLSIVFYRERTLFVDIAFQTVKMITEPGWHIQVYRFGSGIVHALPLAAISMKMPLSVVLISYSISFTLLYLFLYHITVKWLKNEWLGIAIALLFTLNTYDGFYWATSELQQGLAVLIVFFAFLLKYDGSKTWWQWLIIIMAIPTIGFYHPVMFIPFFFLMGFFWLSDKRFRRWDNFIISVLLLVTVFVIKPMYFTNNYDLNKMEEFKRHFWEYYPNFFKLPSNKIFLTNSIKFWYFFPLLFILENVWYLWRKHWLKAFWLTGFSLGFILLTHIGSPTTPYRFYAEVNYMPLTLFVVIPLLFDIVPNIKKKNILVLLFSVTFVIRLLAIYNHHKPYTARVAWFKKQLDNTKQNYTSNKVIIPFTKELESKLSMTWGIPYESLLLSTMNDPKHSATIFVPMVVDKFKENIEFQNNWFVSDFGIVYSDDMDDNSYFNLGKNKYIKIEEVK